MLSLVSVLVLARCAAQEYSVLPEVNTIGLVVDSAVTSQSELPLPNLEEKIRRELMYNNYDYINKQIHETTSTRQASLPPAATSPTRTAALPLVQAATTAHSPPADDLNVRAGHYEQPQQSWDRAAPAEQYIQYQVEVPRVMPPLSSALDSAGSSAPPPRRTSQVSLPPPTQSSPVWLAGALDLLASNEQFENVLDKDLLYYMDDDRLKPGVNFRRYNDEHVHEPGAPRSSAERMYMAPPGFIESTKQAYHHHHRRHHRHRHMQRDAMYANRRIRKRRGPRRGLRRGMWLHPQAGAHDHSSDERPREQRQRLQNGPRRRSRLRYRPHDHRRRAKLNLIRRGLRKQMVSKSADVDVRHNVAAGQDYNALLYNETAKLDNRVHQHEPDYNLYEQDSMSDQNDDYQEAREHNARRNEQQYDQLVSNESVIQQYESQNDLDVNESVEEQVNITADGRRDYNHEYEVTPQNLTEVTHDQQNCSSPLNVSTVKEMRTTYKYKLLQVRGAGGGRRGGGGGAQILEERRQDGVMLVPLGAGRFPQFRLPRARRQYMHERSAVRAPLLDQLQRHTAPVLRAQA